MTIFEFDQLDDLFVADFATDAALSMCVNPTDVFAAGVSTMTTSTNMTSATGNTTGNNCGQQKMVTTASPGNNICCKDVVFNSERRRSSARSLVSLPPGMVDSDADHEDEDMLMDEINWDKLL